MNFSLISSDINNSARLGKISTDHSTFETPVFMPIGTSGAIKTIDPDFLHDLEISIILGNTYHLYLRPGHEIVHSAKGLHSFMNWDKSILTDRGGYQIFSLAKLNNISDEGGRISITHRWKFPFSFTRTFNGYPEVSWIGYYHGI